jgi:hypothetical protein
MPLIDKKTFVLAVVVSWVLTLVTVLLISNFAPSLIQPFSGQIIQSNSVKVVTLQRQEVLNVAQEYPISERSQFNFTLNPSNPHNNAILGIYCSFEYTCDTPNSTMWESRNEIDWRLSFGIEIKEYEYWKYPAVWKSASDIAEWNENWVSEWETATFSDIDLKSEQEFWISQNQNSYPIQLTFFRDSFLSGDSKLSTYVRNVNLMLLVTDG